MKKIKSNNSGFSLLEVLIAMIILAIVCVPLLRAFGTSAQTNAKAKIKMKTTIAAENLMEGIKKLDTPGLEALIEEYKEDTNVNDATVSDEMSADGTKVVGKKIELKVVDHDEMNADLPDGYYGLVTLEAAGTAGDYAYPNANGLNLSDFEPISVRDCAVYTMDQTADDAVYQEYVQRYEKYKTKFPTAPLGIDADYFKKNLKRSMLITIEKAGTYTDEDGEEQPNIRVKLDIVYNCTASNVVEETKYIATSAYLFDNTSSHKKLNGIYLFYYPRYEAAGGSHVGQGYENIVINNNYDIDTNVYITAMQGAPDPDLRTTYINDGHCDITVSEGTLKNGKGHIVLRTNLLKLNDTTKNRTPYSNKDENVGYGLGFRPTYKVNGSPEPDTEAIIKKLTISDIDGKTLNTDDTPIRIYRIRVSICDPDGNVMTELDGTKLKQD